MEKQLESTGQHIWEFVKMRLFKVYAFIVDVTDDTPEAN